MESFRRNAIVIVKVKLAENRIIRKLEESPLTTELRSVYNTSMDWIGGIMSADPCRMLIARYSTISESTEKARELYEKIVTELEKGGANERFFKSTDKSIIESKERVFFSDITPPSNKEFVEHINGNCAEANIGDLIECLKSYITYSIGIEEEKLDWDWLKSVCTTNGGKRLTRKNKIRRRRNSSKSRKFS
jgi:hypothetical protein